MSELLNPQRNVMEKAEALYRETIAARNTEILRLRLDEHWTLQAIADKFGLTRERVRQIVNKHV